MLLGGSNTNVATGLEIEGEDHRPGQIWQIPPAHKRQTREEVWVSTLLARESGALRAEWQI